MKNAYVKTVECVCVGVGKVISGSKGGKPYEFCKAFFTYHDNYFDGVCCFEANVDLLAFPDLGLDDICRFMLIFDNFKLVSARLLGYRDGC